eukprot:gene6877-9530_t
MVATTSASLTPPLVVLCLCVSVVIRCLVGFFGHSGQNDPPLYGDFEAQRHWMEITYHTPISEWYFSTKNNDLNYWGLDYPPLTAYHSWLCGYVAHNFLNSSWVDLHSSRGIEDDSIRQFMRGTSLIVDVLIFIPAALCWVSLCFYRASKRHNMIHQNSRNQELKQLSSYQTLDKRKQKIVTLSTHPKESRLTNIFYFFALLLHPAFILIDHGHFQYNSKDFVKGLVHLTYTGIVVLGTFILCFLPFLFDIRLISQVIHRLFPISRGLFEDKVANFWCIADVFLKMRQTNDAASLARISLTTTVAAILPSGIHVMMKPSLRNFRLALINSSLAFFLFAFQVAICMFEYPSCATAFMTVATISMFPLLYRDHQAIPFIATLGLSVTVYWVAFMCQKTTRLQRVLVAGSTSVGLLLCLLYVLVAPPPHLPDLWSLVLATYGFSHFMLAFLYFNGQQLLSK